MGSPLPVPSQAVAQALPLLPPRCSTLTHLLPGFASGCWQVQNYFSPLCPGGRVWEAWKAVTAAKPRLHVAAWAWQATAASVWSLGEREGSAAPCGRWPCRGSLPWPRLPGGRRSRVSQAPRPVPAAGSCSPSEARARRTARLARARPGERAGVPGPPPEGCPGLRRTRRDWAGGRKPGPSPAAGCGRHSGSLGAGLRPGAAAASQSPALESGTRPWLGKGSGVEVAGPAGSDCIALSSSWPSEDSAAAPKRRRAAMARHSSSKKLRKSGVDGERSAWTCCSRSGQSGEAGSGRHIAPRHRRRTREKRGAPPVSLQLPPRPCPLCSGRSPAPPVSILSRRFPRPARGCPLCPGSSPGPRRPFPRPGRPQEQADNWLHSGLMRTAPGRYTGQGADSWMDGSPAQGRGRSRPERDRRRQEAGTEPLRGHGRLHRHQTPRCPTALSGPSQPPKQLPRVFSDFSPRATFSPSNASSSPESRGDVGKALGNMPGRNRRASTVGLCFKKGSTVPQQSDQEVINQPALT